MAQQSRSDLLAYVLAQLPDNTTRLITPEKLRLVISAMIESLFNLTDDDGLLSTIVADGAVTWSKLNASVLDTDLSNGATANTVPTSAAVLSYTDAAIATAVAAAVTNIKWKASVRGVIQDVAGPSAPTLSGTYTTIDGVALQVGDRVIVNSTVNQTLNGIYVVAAGAWSRSSDANTGTLIKGAAAAVEEGTNFGDKILLCSNNGSITIGSTNITWVVFGQPLSYSAGSGLSLSGTTFSVDSSIVQLRTTTVAAQSGSSINFDNARQDLTTSSGGGGTAISITSFTNTGIGKRVLWMITSQHASDTLSIAVAGATILNQGFSFVPNVVNLVYLTHIGTNMYTLTISPNV